MSNGDRRKKALTIGLILLLMIVLGGAGVLFFKQNGKVSGQGWEGSWDVTYFYEHEPTLLYEGKLTIEMEDSVLVELVVRPPMARRTERLEISNLIISEDGRQISGEVRHTSYKINQGYLQETFAWELTDEGTLRGSGQCAAFCAEGTAGIPITWEGIKTDLTPNKTLQ